MTFEAIVELIKKEFGHEAIISEVGNASPKGIVINRAVLTEVMAFLHQSDQLYFDSLSCITGLDNGPEVNTMEVIYNLYSIPLDHHLMVKVILERDALKIDSLTGIWKTADWLEREVYDLLGITFNNHPDLRRILMPADWDGHPLRKDYQVQEYYHGIKVES